MPNKFKVGDDVLTVAGLRALERQLLDNIKPLRRPYVVIHPKALYVMWGAGWASNWKLVKFWWSMRPTGLWPMFGAEEDVPEQFVWFWDMDLEERTRRILFWMECRPWRQNP